MKSTLFLNAISCVDHAFINDKGQVIGGSYHPNFEVTGKVEEVENVVVDFGSIKKQLKYLIDHKTMGYDHKLWIIPGYSVCTYVQKDGITTIKSAACELSMPDNAVVIFKSVFSGCFQETIEAEFDKYLTVELQKLYTHLDITIKTTMTTDAFKNTDDPIMFRYSHGLKNSSSWGCQNHSHGHLSFIEFVKAKWEDHIIPSPLLAKSINELHNSIFICRDNVTKEDDSVVEIAYTTDRGTFTAQYKKSLNKIIILDTETTIEHISTWYVNLNRSLLKALCIGRVFVSEGLSKGAVVDL